MQLTLMPQNQVFELTAGHPVLDTALAAHVNLPHSCKGGNCGACRARLLAGEVNYPRGLPLGLTAEERAEGYVLLCQAVPRTDLVVEAREIRPVNEVQIRTLPCRVARLERLAPDVMALYLRLPVIEDFHFRAGQYLDILLPGGGRRSFSIASPPHDAGLLELHVRQVSGGEFTQQVFDGLAVGALLRIEGPLGQFVYREPGPERPAGPVILVAGGTGFAPVKAILRALLEGGERRAVHLYWGARHEVDLYQREWLAARLARFPQLQFVPVLSEPVGEEGTRYRSGLVHEAVLQDFPDLSQAEVYAAGPPALIAALREALPTRGLAEDRLYFDAFAYAPKAARR